MLSPVAAGPDRYRGGGIFVPALKIFSGWYKKRICRDHRDLSGPGERRKPFRLPAPDLSGSASRLAFSFIGIGGVSIFLGVLAWVFLRDRPEDKGWPPIVETIPQSPARQTHIPQDLSTGRRLGIIFKSSGFWMLTLSTFFLGGPGLSFKGSGQSPI